MDSFDLIASLEATVEQLCDQMDSGNPPLDSDEYKKLSQRHDDLEKQRDVLEKKVFLADDGALGALTASVVDATKQLTDAIDTTQDIDKIINIAAQISSYVGQIITLIP